MSIRLVALAVPAVLGWLLYDAAAWLVHHDSINYDLSDAGFGFISNAAELIFALGPIVSVGAGLVFALPCILVFLRRVGSVSRALALNISAAIVFLCCLGSMGVYFAGLLAVAPLLWIFAVLWVLTRESNKHLQATPR